MADLLGSATLGGIFGSRLDSEIVLRTDSDTISSPLNVDLDAVVFVDDGQSLKRGVFAEIGYDEVVIFKHFLRHDGALSRTGWKCAFL